MMTFVVSLRDWGGPVMSSGSQTLSVFSLPFLVCWLFVPMTAASLSQCGYWGAGHHIYNPNKRRKKEKPKSWGPTKKYRPSAWNCKVLRIETLFISSLYCLPPWAHSIGTHRCSKIMDLKRKPCTSPHRVCHQLLVSRCFPLGHSSKAPPGASSSPGPDKQPQRCRLQGARPGKPPITQCDPDEQTCGEEGTSKSKSFLFKNKNHN